MKRGASRRARSGHALGFSLLAFVIFYAWEFIHFNFAEPTIARDYVAEHNEKIEEIPQEDRAWPLYREAIIAMHPIEHEVRMSIHAEPGDSEWRTLVEFIDRRQEALELFREASKRRVLDVPWEADIALLMEIGHDHRIPKQAKRIPQVVEVASWYSTDFTRASRLLDAEIRLAVLRDEPGRATANIAALIRMGAHERVAEILLDAFIDQVISHLGIRALLRVQYRDPDFFDDEQLRRLTSVLAASDGDPRPALAGERMIVDDLIQRAFSDDGNGDGSVLAAGHEFFDELGEEPRLSVLDRLLAPFRRRMIASRAEQIRRLDEIIDEHQHRGALPLWESLNLDELPESPEDQPRIFWLIDLALPVYERYLNGTEILRQKRDVAIAVLALELYKRQKGSYPDSLAELVPDFLAEAPVDRFDGQPLRYEVRNGAPFLYSVGTNQIDDGGVPAFKPDGSLLNHPSKRKIEGDWILFPPDRLLYPQEKSDAFKGDREE